MITLSFGLHADMRGKTYTSPALDTQLGSITGINGHTSTTVTAGTSKGATVVMEGKFKFGNQSSLLDSHVNGVSFFDHDHNLMLSLSGVPSVTYSDLARQDKGQAMVTFMLHDAGNGVIEQGSGFNDILVGFGGNDQIFGNAGNDVLQGGAGNDVLNGGSGNDRLDGGVGNDVMTGGAGNDTYIVDSSGDTVIEKARGGNDSVQANVSWTMSAQVENLNLTGSHAINGTGNASDNEIVGNAAANTLRGMAGNDRLDGGRGADHMDGGLGNDLFIVDNVHDVVLERADQGIDTIRSSVSYHLPDNVENLLLLGSTNLDGTGNTLDNLLTGNAGNNHLSGGNGNDTLLPGHGHDVLTGGVGADNFVITGGDADTLSITDLLSGTDHLFITPDAVSAMTPGASVTGQLRASGVVADGNDFLVYDQASGVLSYDATGNGGSLHTLASLGAGTVLLADDITIGLPPHG